MGERRIEKQKKLLDHETLRGKCIISADGVERVLTIEDIEMSCYYPRETIIEKKVSCDSHFMLENLPIVGARMCESMPWVTQEETMYLIMDNAGGHGTNNAIDEYTNRLVEDYNIQIIHQFPRSPEVNALDLGVWMSIQFHVEKCHHSRTRNPDALTVTVHNAWG